jgi:chromosome partitioning protein
VLIPCQPSLLDLWSTRATLELCAREGRPHLLVLNRVPPRGRVLEQVRARIAADRVPLAASSLGNRAAFAVSLGEGLGVAESDPRSIAAREIQALADEVLQRLA